MRNKVPVSKRALIQRINRELRKSDDMLRTARGARAKQSLGEYYVVDIFHNAIAQMDVDLEDLGKELKVLREYEVLV